MANKLEKGGIYKATRVKAGTSARGPWMLTVVADDRGRNEITLFIKNSDCDLKDNGQFKIKELVSMTLGVRKGKGEDVKWYPSYTAEAIIEPIQSEFSDLEDIDPSDPWKTLAGDPFAIDPENELPL